MKKSRHFVISFFVLVQCFYALAFKPDSLESVTDTAIYSTETNNKDSLFIATHSPRKASVYSAVFPGLGQIYNRKYWKVPIVYAGFGVLISSTIYNGDRYVFYKEKYKYMLDNNLEEWEDVTRKEAEVYKDYHRRYRDLFIILTAGFYALQIVDATVDAYLIDFDIGNDISLGVDPSLYQYYPGNYSFGLRCCLSF